MRIVWSVHDLSPASMPEVRQIIGRLNASRITRLTLLIIPGRLWPDDDIGQLQAWENTGYTLAAHGWTHRAVKPGKIQHAIHSRFFSRDSAEHLSKTRVEIRDILAHGQQW